MFTVVALRDGHYGSYRKPGETFVVTDKAHLSKRWMAVEGTPEYTKFMRSNADADERDQLTGERLAAGGMAEQLSVLLDEKAKLVARVEELEAELEAYKNNKEVPDTQDEVAVVAGPAEMVVTPGAPDEDPDEPELPMGDKPAAKQRRRRTKT